MKNNRVRGIPFIVQFKFFLSEKSVAKFVFTPGTNKFKATAKSDLFVVSSVSSPGTDADTIINYKSKDRIDLPGDWTKRNGKPRIIKRLFANYIFSDTGFRVDDLDETALVKKPGQTDSLALGRFDINLRGFERIEGLVLVKFNDSTQDLNASPSVLLINYSGPVTVI